MVASVPALAGRSVPGRDWVERARTATVTLRFVFAAEAGVNRKPDVIVVLRENAMARRGSADAGVKLPSARPTAAGFADPGRAAAKVADDAIRLAAAAKATGPNVQKEARVVIGSP